MSGEPVPENVLLVALGGSGRRTAVLLREKILHENQENSDSAEVNLKIISIDFPYNQDTGYFVKSEEYLPLLLPGLQFNECWKALQKDKESMTEEEKEPWMNIAPISQMELWLAQDAQQSGIRRVDYFLLAHYARPRIEGFVRDALASFPKTDNLPSPITVIILGSLAGRTGSICYLPVVRIFDSLASEFKFESTFSFLYTPNAFEMRMHPENEFNFLESLASIRNYFDHNSIRSFKPTQILVDEPNSLLTSYRDPERPLPFSQNIENIEELIGLAGNEDAASRGYEEWLRSIKRINISDIDALADRNKQRNSYNHNDRFAIPQNWTTSSLEKFFSNLEKNI